MAAIKIDKFLGESPKVSSEQLPDTAAQTAYNVKISSGDLVPYRVPVVADNTERTVESKTIYGVRDPSTNALDFLSFTTQPKEQVGLNNLVKLWQMQNGQSVANNDTIQAVNAAKQAPRTAGVLQGQAPQSPKTDTDNMFDGIINSGSGARLP